MESLVTAILYVGVVILVPLLVVIPLLLLEYVRSEDATDRRLSGRSTDASPGGRVTDSTVAAVRSGTTDDRTVSCRSCGAVNETGYTFCRECTDLIAGR